MALRRAVDRFGAPATVQSDNGSRFVGEGGRNRPGGSWTPTAFENELPGRKMGLINARPHPQTDGKLERFHYTLENEIVHYEDPDDCIEYYSADRPHFSPDLDNYEAPLTALRVKKATKKTRLQNPDWMGEDNGRQPGREQSAR